MKEETLPQDKSLTSKSILATEPQFRVSEIRHRRRRLTPQSYKMAVLLLLRIQSGNCAVCGSPFAENRVLSPELDHLNGDPSDNDPSNLRLLHKSCNIRERNKQKSWLANYHKSADNASESESEKATAEIEINRDAEPRYRKWLFERTGRKEPLYSQEAIYGGAEIVGISPITARRYLGKVTSPQGSYWVAVVKAANRTLKQVVPK